MWSSKSRCSRIAATTAAATLALSLIGATPLALANEPNNGPSHGLCESREICGPWQQRHYYGSQWRDHDRDHDNDRNSRPYYYMHGPSYYYNYPSY